MMAQAQRLILIAIDGSDNSEKAFQCTVLFHTVIVLYRTCCPGHVEICTFVNLHWLHLYF